MTVQIFIDFDRGKIKRFCFKVKSNGTLINAEKADLTKGARF